MKFSGKMCLMIILKVRKNQGFTLSLEHTFFEIPQGSGVKLNPPPAVLGLNLHYHMKYFGILIDEMLSWNKQIDNICTNLVRASGILLKLVIF